MLMPLEHGLGFHQLGRRLPSGPYAGQQHPQEAKRRVKPRAGLSLLADNFFVKGALTAVAPENSDRLQNQQDTMRLCNIVTWMNFRSPEFLRTTVFRLSGARQIRSFMTRSGIGCTLAWLRVYPRQAALDLLPGSWGPHDRRPCGPRHGKRGSARVAFVVKAERPRRTLRA